MGLNVGLFSALGRLSFGVLADWTPKKRGPIGLELGFTGSLGALSVVSGVVSRRVNYTGSLHIFMLHLYTYM